MDGLASMVVILVPLSLILVLILRTYNFSKDTEIKYKVNIAKYVVLLSVFITIFLLSSVFLGFRSMMGQKTFWFVGFTANMLILNWLLVIGSVRSAKNRKVNSVKLLVSVAVSSFLVFLINELDVKVSLIHYSQRYLYSGSSPPFFLMFMYFFTVVGTLCASIIPSMLFVKKARNKLEHVLLTLLIFVSTSILLQESSYGTTWTEGWTRTFVNGLILGSTLVLLTTSIGKLKKIRSFIANSSELLKEMAVLYLGSLFLIPVCFISISTFNSDFFFLERYNLLNLLLFMLFIPARVQVYLHFVVSTLLYISLKKKK